MKSPADPPRLFVVIGSLHVGGTEQHLARVLPELVQRGWRVTLFTLSGEGSLRAALERGGVDVRFTPLVGRLLRGRILALRLLRLIAVTVHLVWLMRTERPMVAHFFLPEAYVMGGFCGLVAGVPRMIMSRRSLNHYQRARPMVARAERWLHRRMSLIVGNSHAVVRELEEEGVPPARLRLIYNGITLPPPIVTGARAGVRASLGIGADTLVIIIVANLLPYKGHLDLIEALTLVAGELPTDWRLLCAGRDLGHGETLRQRTHQCGLDRHVLWLGGRDDVADLFGAADIGVLASHQEGFSNAVLEGMGAGLPMIVTDVGGNAEAVLDGDTGCVVPAQHPTELAQAILRLASDKALRLRLGRAGRDRVARHFTLSACVDRYEEMYGRKGVLPIAVDETTVAAPTNAESVPSNPLISKEETR
jgi:glycosyltransferase involved in cell wall biosynthesis